MLDIMESRADNILKAVRQSMSSDKDLLMILVTRWKEVEESMRFIQMEVHRMVQEKNEAMELLKGQNSDLDNLFMRLDVEDFVKGK